MDHCSLDKIYILIAMPATISISQFLHPTCSHCGTKHTHEEEESDFEVQFMPY